MANPYGIEGKIELLRYEGEAVKCISFQTGNLGHTLNQIIPVSCFRPKRKMVTNVCQKVIFTFLCFITNLASPMGTHQQMI